MGAKLRRATGANLRQRQQDNFARAVLDRGGDSLDLPQQAIPSPLVVHPQGIFQLRPRLKTLGRVDAYHAAVTWQRNSGLDALLVFDPDIISNHGLANGSNADIFIPQILEFIGDRDILIDESLRNLSPSETAPPLPEVRDIDIPRLLQPPLPIFGWRLGCSLPWSYGPLLGAAIIFLQGQMI